MSARIDETYAPQADRQPETLLKVEEFLGDGITPVATTNRCHVQLPSIHSGMKLQDVALSWDIESYWVSLSANAHTTKQYQSPNPQLPANHG